MQVNGFPVQRQEEIDLFSMGADPGVSGPDDGKGMTSPNQGGIIVIDIDPVAASIQKMAQNQRGPVDAFACLAARQDGEFPHFSSSPSFACFL